MRSSPSLRMKKSLFAHNTGGGDNVEYREIILNGVTYEVHRTFNGTRPAEELVSERFTKRLAENFSFDAPENAVI